MATNKQFEKFLVQNRKEFIDNFWLGLGDVSKIQTRNTFKENKIWKDNPVLAILDIMRQPEYFHFTCKHLFNITMPPFQAVIQKTLWTHDRPILIGSRGMSKTYSLAVYALLKTIFDQGIKVVVTAAAFRQAKLIFEYMETIWKNSEMLQDILSDDRMNKPSRDIDRCVFRIGQSTTTCIPTGTGDKIRGLRAGILIVEEFNAVDVNIFENVMQGFSAVSTNPVDKMQQISKLEAMKALGDLTESDYTDEIGRMRGNQCILSGTCGYTFEHFFKYFKKYKDVIESRGDINVLNNIFNGEIPANFSHKDYAIVRIPYDLIPRGFMDEKTIAHAKASVHTGAFGAEYGAVFAADTEGFFKKSLVERAVCGKPNNPIIKQHSGQIYFEASMHGIPKARYIYGIDPASETNNFAIVIVEMWPDHRRIVHTWTINKQRFKNRLKNNLVAEHDYYRYCCRRIRDLMRLFPCERIALDSQGGGYTIIEILGDPTFCREGERPIYETIVDDDEKPTDNLDGLHIIQKISFADAQWTSEANHGLRSDLENRDLIFPAYDSIIMGLALERDRDSGRIKEGDDELYDSLQGCMLEIEDLKNELITIVHTKTANGRDHWDTPEIKTVIGKKGRLQKDRYSALLMANMVARTLDRVLPEPEYNIKGGAAHIIATNKNKKKGEHFIGPEWYVNQMKKSFGGFGGVSRKRGNP